MKENKKEDIDIFFLTHTNIYESIEKIKELAKNKILIVEYGITNIVNFNSTIWDKPPEIYQKVSNLLKEFDGEKCLRIEDMHDQTFKGGYKTLLRYVEDHNINYILTIYNKNFEYKYLRKLFENTNVKFLTVPYSINTNIFKNYGNKKEYDILFYGSVSPNYYFRIRILKLLQNNIFKKYKIKILPNNGEYSNELLANEINKSWLCISITSIHDYLVRRYFEIPACFSCILGDIPEQGKEIIGDNIIEIKNEMNDEKIINIIEKALENKEDIIKKTNNLYELINKKYFDDLGWTINKKMLIDKFYKLKNFNNKNNKKNNKKLISILLPTRGRYEMLKESIESLLENMDEKNRIEILLRMDDDDETNIEKVKNYINNYNSENG
jgi:hypothetical protein